MKCFNRIFFVFLVSLFFFNGIAKADVVPVTHYDAQGRIDYIEYYENGATTPQRSEHYHYGGNGGVPTNELSVLVEYNGPIDATIPFLGTHSNYLSRITRYGYLLDLAGDVIFKYVKSVENFSGDWAKKQDGTEYYLFKATHHVVERVHATWWTEDQKYYNTLKINTYDETTEKLTSSIESKYYFVNGRDKKISETHYDSQGRIDYIEYWEEGRTEDYEYGVGGNLIAIAEFKGAHNGFDRTRVHEFYMLSHSYYYDMDANGNYVSQLAYKKFYQDGDIQRWKTIDFYRKINGQDIVVQTNTMAADRKLSHAIEFGYDRLSGKLWEITETDYQEPNRGDASIIRRVNTIYDSRHRISQINHYGDTDDISNVPFSDIARVEQYYYTDSPNSGIFLNGSDYVVVDYRRILNGIDPDDSYQGTSYVLTSYHFLDSKGRDRKVVSFLNDWTGKPLSQVTKNTSYHGNTHGNTKRAESVVENGVKANNSGTQKTHETYTKWAKDGSLWKQNESFWTYHANGKVATFEQKEDNLDSGEFNHIKQHYNEAGKIVKTETFDRAGKVTQTIERHLASVFAQVEQKQAVLQATTQNQIQGAKIVGDRVDANSKVKTL